MVSFVGEVMKLDLKNKKVVVVDGNSPLSHDNLCFDPAVVREKWYRYSGALLYEQCIKRGMQLLTPDLYFKYKPSKAICMRDSSNGPNHTKQLRKFGVRLAVLVALEQPLYTPWFYWHLKKESEYFDHTFTYGSLKGWVSSRSRFNLFVAYNIFPNKPLVQVPFENKKYLTLINSNHRIHYAKRMYTKLMNYIEPMPTLENSEQYIARLRAIQYFSSDPRFDLYGTWWDKPVRYTRGIYDEAIKEAYRGVVDDKIETLRNYKFALCFENCILGGLITEKITDALIAGCVPVYWGAPDVTDFIPSGCFIDFREFNYDFSKLEHYLNSMNEATYNHYIENIEAFIVSNATYVLSANKYMNDLIEIFESYF
ncbi:MAG: hypothetical protein A3A04_00585 [Candidatus Harrisonbacteria bacterium RIFCSPLOWO2_01_FULL_40_28]|uniref:Fucosyltransferase C-terminal domain-containing protein n=2 Tax=Candidatus Harrisoniibacteriota TaxID=1817905 RepID=A0A1G1ZWC5_9BACT|nr:MAG: hypothetical protein A3A04_00585 [Candidatus Harrisonbacteria bacterium RIFCSPLOWO2_01_FULL_40_28]OGY68446.1 MAG: hypothetical protein A2586_01080 [Candidatus Harrisonbacteria bacterium RIFOXYD1_FULL_40_9]